MATDEAPGTARLRILSEEETAALLRACADPCERAAVGLLVEAGLRPRETCGLRAADVLREAIRVRSKDGRERAVALGPRLSRALHRCLRERGATPGAEDPLLLASDGRPLDVRALGEMVRDAVGRAGLPGRPGPHALRATVLWLRCRRTKPGDAGGMERETR